MCRGIISLNLWGGGSRGSGPGGVQGAEPLGGGQVSPSVFGILKVFLTCIFVGNMIKFPKQLYYVLN